MTTQEVTQWLRTHNKELLQRCLAEDEVTMELLDEVSNIFKRTGVNDQLLEITPQLLTLIERYKAAHGG